MKGTNLDISVGKIRDSLVSEPAFAAVTKSDYVFGCLDSEGARFILNELCAAYTRVYFDLASDIVPGNPPTYGGRVFVAGDGEGCIVCYGVLDMAEVQVDLGGPQELKNREGIYGVQPDALDHVGPSVVSINGVIASLAVTEFMVMATGIRLPKRFLKYHGNMGRVSAPGDDERINLDCYYCKRIRGMRDQADVQRYVREGVGEFLR